MKEESKSNPYKFTKDLMYVQLGDTYAYALLMFLCHAARPTGISWHGFDSIRRVTGMGRQAIRSATRKLVELGLIEARLRRQDTKTYTVHYEALVALVDRGKAAYEAARQVANDLSQSHQDRSVTHLETGRQRHQHRSVTHVKTGRNRPPNLVSNCVKELVNKTTGDSGEPVSGEREKFGMTIDELVTEVTRLKQLKRQAIHDCQPTDYSALTVQLRERQQELNVARGMAYKKTMPTRSSASVTS